MASACIIVYCLLSFGESYMEDNSEYDEFVAFESAAGESKRDDDDDDASIMSLRKQISDISKRLQDLRVEDNKHDDYTVEDTLLSSSKSRSTRAPSLSRPQVLQPRTHQHQDSAVMAPVSQRTTRHKPSRSDTSVDSLYSALDDEAASVDRLRAQLRRATKAANQLTVVCILYVMLLYRNAIKLRLNVIHSGDCWKDVKKLLIDNVMIWLRFVMMMTCHDAAVITT